MPPPSPGSHRHRSANRLHTVLLLAGMIGLLVACGWIVAGPEGGLWALVLGGVSLAFAPRLSPQMVLGMYGAVPVRAWDMPKVTAILNELAERAGLPRTPQLYWIPSPTLNAFAMGTRGDAVIAVTDGLVRSLSARELAGVLGHEITHIANGDLWLMGLADTVSRLTRMMSLFGQILLLFNLPLLIAGAVTIPWGLILLLVLAPTIGALLQLALSRTREYDADLGGALLTGDPLALAGALRKLEQYGRGLWESLMLPNRRNPSPSLLRTHPPTEERIRRLVDLRGQLSGRPALPGIDALAQGGAPVAGRFRIVPAQPRHRLTGLWY
ncbi:M48 family metalloprotease [Skermanella sp. TT6]|uniref:M48 family metalloprotease n=1 Tax=Skermanella cutis TaxID=2775420 RepID=A0ABX7BDI5_9PROT|nr:M48 family metalloprotease [Skermanella sp. TT6]